MNDKTVNNKPTLESHNKKVLEEFSTMIKNRQRPQLNGIACPKCGAELYDSEPGLLLLSYPPQHAVHCGECGWKGTRY